MATAEQWNNMCEKFDTFKQFCYCCCTVFIGYTNIYVYSSTRKKLEMKATVNCSRLLYTLLSPVMPIQLYPKLLVYSMIFMVINLYNAIYTRAASYFLQKENKLCWKNGRKLIDKRGFWLKKKTTISLICKLLYFNMLYWYCSNVSLYYMLKICLIEIW